MHKRVISYLFFMQVWERLRLCLFAAACIVLFQLPPALADDLEGDQLRESDQAELLRQPDVPHAPAPQAPHVAILSPGAEEPPLALAEPAEKGLE